MCFSYFKFFLNTRAKCINIINKLIYPSLLETLCCSFRIDLCCNGYTSCDISCFGLRAAHTAQSSSNEQQSFSCAIIDCLISALSTKHARCIHNRNGCAVHNALRTNVHVGSRSHLSVLRYTQRIEFLPIVWLAVIRNHHSVRHHNARRRRTRREQSHRMTTVHHERLLFGHFTQILHHQTILRPVLKNRTVPTIGNQFIRMLCHAWIQVVLNHEHDGCCLLTLCRIFRNRSRIHFVCRTIAVHVNASVCLQLFSKFLCQCFVQFRREIAKGIAQG